MIGAACVVHGDMTIRSMSDEPGATTMGNAATEDDDWGPVVPDGDYEEADDPSARSFEPATLGLQVDVPLLVEVTAALDDRVPYLLGGKPSSIKLTTEQFLAERGRTGVDCSGFVRWLLYRASGGRVKIPDGSVNQRDRFRARADDTGVAAVPYASCGDADGILRVAGFTRSARIRVGHIWLVVDGHTIESHGRHGVNRRPWDTASLVDLATWCFPLAAPTA
jgi:hypothetical protein